MGEIKLEEIAKFAVDGAVSTNLYDSQKARVGFLCMKSGQSALEDTRGKKVIVVINSGCGVVITDQGEQEVEEETLVLFEADEPCLLRAKTRLTALVVTMPG